MTDANEQSIPSRGSRGEPVAWAITANGRFVEAHGTKDRAMFAVTVRESQMSLIEGVPCKADGTPVEHEVIPLYRQPGATLTDEERRAIRSGIENCEDITYGGPNDEEAATVLRGLLERLG